MNLERFQVLIDLHHNIFTEDLISNDFYFIFKQILSPREREIVLDKINGLTDQEIAKKFGCTIKSIKRRIYEIQYKYRNGVSRRVDNWKKIDRRFRHEKQNKKT